MTIFTYALGCYFAAALLVAGLAKLANPASFAATLRRSRLVPRWGVAAVGHLVPLGEIALAALLVTGLARRPVALANAALFGGFLGAKVALLLRRERSCGCYGVADADHLDGASIGTSALLVGLAFAHLRLVYGTESPPLALPVATSTMFASAGLWLGVRTWQRQMIEWRLCNAPSA